MDIQPASPQAEIEKDANDLKAIRKAVEDAASVGGPLWFSYLFVMLYIALAAGAVKHSDLLLELPVELPFLSIKLSLIAFFILAPVLFVISHTYILAHFALLSDKAKRFHDELHRQIHDPELRRGIREQLPINMFVQFLAGPVNIRDGYFSIFLWAVAWITLVAGPIILLLLIQVQFLPYHDNSVSTLHRFLVVIDMIIVFIMWMKILSGRNSEPAQSKRAFKTIFFLACKMAAWPLGLAIAYFAFFIAVYPNEWRGSRAPFMETFEWGAATQKIFGVVDAQNGSVTGTWPTNTLHLKEFDLYQGLKIEEPSKLDWKAYIFDFQGRHLEHADLRLSYFPRANFKGAFLEGAILDESNFSKAQFNDAHLTRSSAKKAQMKDASLEGADLSESSLQEITLTQAKLSGAHLEGSNLSQASGAGANFSNSNMQGASLERVNFPGARLDSADLRGANLDSANLQGAELVETKLQGATLRGAFLLATELGSSDMRGASLVEADMRGASLIAADLRGADISLSSVWRSEWGFGENDANLGDVKCKRLNWHSSKPIPQALGDDENIKEIAPLVGFNRDFTEVDYEKLVFDLTDDITDSELKDEIKERFSRLSCKNRVDDTLSPCKSSSRPSNHSATWRRRFDALCDAPQEKYESELMNEIIEIGCTTANSIFAVRGMSRITISKYGRVCPPPDTVKDDEIAGTCGRMIDAGKNVASIVDAFLSEKCALNLTDEDRRRLEIIKNSAH